MKRRNDFILLSVGLKKYYNNIDTPTHYYNVGNRFNILTKIIGY